MANHERRLAQIEQAAWRRSERQQDLAGARERILARLADLHEHMAQDGPLPAVDVDNLQARLQALRPALLAQVARMQP